jgi:hypothetical protein
MKSLAPKSLCSLVATALAIGAGAVPAFAGGPGSGNGATNFYVQDVSSTMATVVAQYYGPSGSVDATRSVTVNSGATAEFLASASGLGSGWKGSVVVSSDQDIVAAAETVWTDIPGASGLVDQYERDAYGAFNIGSTSQYIPGIVINGATNGERGQLTVQNTTSSAITTYTSWQKRGAASPDYVSIETIPGFSSHTYDLGVPGGTTPDLLALNSLPSTGAWTGSAIVTSTSPIAAALSTQFLKYSAQTESTSTPGTQFISVAYPRRYQYGAWQEHGILTLQNPNDSEANVRVDFVNKATGGISMTITTTIGAHNAVGINAKDTGCAACSPVVSGSAMAALGGSIASGSVTYAGTVSITSDIPIVGFTTIKQEFNDQGDIFNLVNTDGATDEMGFVPHAMRSANGTASTDWSRINIANLGQVNATVVISFYNSSGTLQGVLKPAVDIGASKVIAPGAVASINMKSGGDLATTALLDSKVGSGFNGSMVIAADQPIAVLVDGISSSDGNPAQTSTNIVSFDSYNGFTR